jgi:hypothetical protein
MIDYQKIKTIQEKIDKNKKKLIVETDYKKKEVLKLKIKIDELKIKLERFK